MDDVDEGAEANPLKSGDIVLFAGLGRRLIKWFSRSPWTHVGLVLRGLEDPEPLLWEAGCSGPRRGTVVVRLAARIAGFPGKISVRRLNRAFTATQCERLEGLRRELAGRLARHGLLDLMGAADDGWLGARPGILGNPTDGELVAEVYQRLGLLDDVAHGGVPASAYRPWQFAERYGLELRRGYVLGPEVALSEAGRALGWSGLGLQTAGA